jgi:hypothetical protein
MRDASRGAAPAVRPEHARAGHHAFDVALRHQEQALALEADDFRLDLRAVRQRDGAGAADRQAQADAFHHQAGHARDAARHLHRLDEADQGMQSPR